MKVVYSLLIASLLLPSIQAHAQWQWVDKDGRKVFSDRAPSADIPEKNILKRPGKASTQTGSEGTAAPDSATPPSTPVATLPTPKKSELDTKLEEKKKQSEQTEAAKRRAEEERVAKARAENCAQARKAKAALDSGVRMATINAKGEREIMDDTARAAEGQRIQSVIAKECN